MHLNLFSVENTMHRYIKFWLVIKSMNEMKRCMTFACYLDSMLSSMFIKLNVSDERIGAIAFAYEKFKDCCLLVWGKFFQ
jgi:IS4 transposase